MMPSKAATHALCVHGIFRLVRELQIWPEPSCYHGLQLGCGREEKTKDTEIPHSPLLVHGHLIQEGGEGQEGNPHVPSYPRQ
eukprot:NODE_2938_length_1009_cov_2.791667_g2455_i0.p5 GENE.NODE_2938_length_1009_cov_2.791667_g2455_i0~~NODE_2938_length_1009_cov_2.791667_g2455_i0.p5  ORF type:complete len:82 (-),score=0.98 NODE_2938_length_1009_cov_2.791667_g2455_i0:199-444(-)